MLILASASPARRKLLEKAGIDHRVIVSGFDETTIQSPDAIQLVESLALAKASAVVSKLFLESSGNSYLNKISGVLGCDSVFEFQGEVFGKPKDSNEAIRRWMRMSSKSGFLHTGHVFLGKPFTYDSEEKVNSGFVRKDCISTRVHFVELSYSEIKTYVETGEPLQCAGGFALEGLAGMFISRLEGCYTNVLGLSMPWIRQEILLGDSNKNPFYQ